MTKTEFMWAIAGIDHRGRSILYCGTHLTRRMAIRDHVENFSFEAGLYNSKDLMKRWRMYRARGDRAVKVMITYEAPD